MKMTADVFEMENWDATGTWYRLLITITATHEVLVRSPSKSLLSFLSPSIPTLHTDLFLSFNPFAAEEILT